MVFKRWMADKVLGCTSNGGTLEEATAKLLHAAKDRWSDYDENYCETSLQFRMEQLL